MNGQPDSKVLTTLLKLLPLGYWPIPIYPPGVQRKDREPTKGKEPIGKGWGLERWTEQRLRDVFRKYPSAGGGMAFGPERGPGRSWCIDLEGDGPEAADSLARFLGGEEIETVAWDSTRGGHNVFTADGERLLDLLKKAGAKEGAGNKGAGVWHLDQFPGLEFRVGGWKSPGVVKQVQSVIPPTVGSDGRERRWLVMPNVGLAPLPEASYALLERLGAERAAAAEPLLGDGGEPAAASATAKRPCVTIEDRVVRYLAKTPPAVSGQSGHDTTFGVACRVGPGFDLSQDEAFRLLWTHYNPKCLPPWSEGELRHKVEDAYQEESRRGWLLGDNPPNRGQKGTHHADARPRAGAPGVGRNGDGGGNGAMAAGEVPNEAPADADGNGDGMHGVNVNHIRGATTHDAVNLTELGNAMRLVAAHGERLRYCKPFDQWYEWEGTRWKPDETGAIWRYAKDVVRRLAHEAGDCPDERRRKALLTWALKSEEKKIIAATIGLAWSEPGITIMPGDLDRDPWLLNTPSGTVNLKTGDLQPHRQDDLISKITKVPYDPDAKCPKWLAALKLIFGGDKDLIAYVKRALGYSLTGTIGEHAMFLNHGSGRNGKNTILEVPKILMHDYASVVDPRIFMTKGSNDHPAMLADLVGRRMVLTSEIEEGEKLAEALVKRVTGDKTIKARFMCKNPFEFPVLFKLWMVANVKPEISGRDDGIWSRIRFVPFDVYIEPKDRIKNYSDILVAEEGPGILAWLVEGCREWQEVAGLHEPDKVVQAIDDYKTEQDVTGDFLNQCCNVYLDNEELRKKARVKPAELYARYDSWCNQNREKNILTSRKFGSELTKRGFPLDVSHGVRYRYALTLKDAPGYQEHHDDKYHSWHPDETG